MKVSVVSIIAIIIFLSCSNLLHSQQSNLYRNNEHEFRILFPKGWTVGEGGYGPNVVVKALDGKGGSINIVVKNIPKEEYAKIGFDSLSEAGLNNYAMEVFNAYKKAYPNSLLEDHGITHLSDKKAVWLRILTSFTVPAGTVKTKGLQMHTFNKGKQYIISCGTTSEKFNKYETLFLKTTSSFFFEDKSWYRK